MNYEKKKKKKKNARFEMNALINKWFFYDETFISGNSLFYWRFGQRPLSKSLKL